MAKHAAAGRRAVPVEVVDLREKYFAVDHGMTVEVTPNLVTNLIELWVDPTHPKGDAVAAVANLRFTRDAALDLADQLIRAATR